MTEKKHPSFADLVEEVARTVEPPLPPEDLALPGEKPGRVSRRWLLPALATGLVIIAAFTLSTNQNMETTMDRGLPRDRVVVEHLTIGGVSAPAHVLAPPGTDALVIDARSQAKSAPNGRDPQNAL